MIFSFRFLELFHVYISVISEWVIFWNTLVLCMMVGLTPLFFMIAKTAREEIPILLFTLFISFTLQLFKLYIFDCISVGDFQSRNIDYISIVPFAFSLLLVFSLCIVLVTTNALSLFIFFFFLVVSLDLLWRLWPVDVLLYKID